MSWQTCTSESPMRWRRRWNHRSARTLFRRTRRRRCRSASASNCTDRHGICSCAARQPHWRVSNHETVWSNADSDLRGGARAGGPGPPARRGIRHRLDMPSALAQSRFRLAAPEAWVTTALSHYEAEAAGHPRLKLAGGRRPPAAHDGPVGPGPPGDWQPEPPPPAS